MTAFALAFLVGPCSQAADVAGYVLSVQGQWSLQGQRAPLLVGAPVAEGARLLAASPAAGDHIVVVAARSGAVLVARHCDTARACTRPVVVPAPSDARSGESPVARLLNGILARIAGDVDRYIPTLSRGSAGVVEAVMPWSERGVDLAPVFPGLAAASDAEIAVTTVQCRGPGACPEQPLTSRIGGPAGERSTMVQGLAPGLYEVVVLTARGQIGPERIRARVLLLPAPQHAQAEELYRAGASLAERWGTNVDAATKQGFLDALLEELAGL
ncbi:MAG TPA: hypothetical protein VLD35_08675 [Caldimonas sp.]|nr:hypothetical protein [Caldimonas sp.]